MQPMEERFWSKVDRSGGPDACWPWLASLNGNGYGQFMVHHGNRKLAHRMAFAILHDRAPGPILDHTCHNKFECVGGKTCTHRRCVNPAHLEEVTPAENNIRGRAGWWKKEPRATCRNGHPATPENQHIAPAGYIRCRACVREWAARKRAERVFQQ